MEKTASKLDIVKTVLLTCILVILVIGILLLAVQFANIQACLNTVQQELKAINVDEINSAVTALKDAANTLKGIDIDALNSLVGSLDSVATKLQNAVNAVTGIFGR